MADDTIGEGAHAAEHATVLEDVAVAFEPGATLGSPDQSFLESSFFDFTWPDGWGFRDGY